MPKDYTVKSWQVWQDETGPITDQHGNYKGSVSFNEYPNPVDGTFKTQPAEGDVKFGDIVDYTTKSGKTRFKFQRADRQPELAAASGQQHKAAYVPRDDEAIKAQWSIGQAVSIELAFTKKADFDFDNVEANARHLFAMIERVKHGISSDPSAATSNKEPEPTPPPDNDIYNDSDGDPVDLKDIPF